MKEKVLIYRKYIPKEYWGDKWVFYMDEFVGKEGYVVKVYDKMIKVGFDHIHFNFPKEYIKYIRNEKFKRILNEK